MRIAVLCNDRLGIPALQQLSQSGLLKAAATSDRSPEMIAIMQQITSQARIPSQVFSRDTFETDLHIWLEQHKPDVVLVKTFPYRIPASALSIPKFGFINFHYAPLPQFRGSNPLFWMIRNGITSGGVTVHRMDEHFDNGPILLQQSVVFNPDATFGICSTQLAYTGATLTPQLLQGLISSTLKETAQDRSLAKWYGRPKPSDLLINWQNMTAAQIKSLVKACNPWLKGAPARFRNWPVGITDADTTAELAAENIVPGTILRLSKTEGCSICCKDRSVLDVKVIYTEEGFFSGDGLAQFGLKAGDQLN
jgi:methionyl-tRNA formyltransferase